MIIDHTVIIALFWWAGNRIPKRSVFFIAKKETVPTSVGREEPALEENYVLQQHEQNILQQKERRYHSRARDRSGYQRLEGKDRRAHRMRKAHTYVAREGCI